MRLQQSELVQSSSRVFSTNSIHVSLRWRDGNKENFVLKTIILEENQLICLTGWFRQEGWLQQSKAVSVLMWAPDYCFKTGSLSNVPFVSVQRAAAVRHLYKALTRLFVRL